MQTTILLLAQDVSAENGVIDLGAGWSYVSFSRLSQPVFLHPTIHPIINSKIL